MLDLQMNPKFDTFAARIDGKIRQEEEIDNQVVILLGVS